MWYKTPMFHCNHSLIIKVGTVGPQTTSFVYSQQAKATSQGNFDSVKLQFAKISVVEQTGEVELLGPAIPYKLM